MALSADGNSLKIVSGKVSFNKYCQWKSPSGIIRIVPEISLDDIALLYQNIGITPTSGLYDVAALCTDMEINQYSLIKPFYAEHPYQTKDDLKNLLIGSVSYPYGYTIPATTMSDSAMLLLFFTNSASLWSFHEPQYNSYKSLAHFDGYNHNAPKGLFPISNMTAYLHNSSTVRVSISWAGNNSKDNVHPSNMGESTINYVPISSLKLAVAFFIRPASSSNWRYLTSFDTGYTADKTNNTGEISTMDLTTNTSIGFNPSGSSDIDIRAIPFLHQSSSASTAFLSSATKWSIRLHDDLGYREFLLLAFSWGVRPGSFEWVPTGWNKKVKFNVEILKGTGTVSLEATDFEIKITSMTFGESETSYSSSCYVGTGTSSAFTLNNKNGATATSVELRTQQSFFLSSGKYNIDLLYGKGDAKKVIAFGLLTV